MPISRKFKFAFWTVWNPLLNIFNPQVINHETKPTDTEGQLYCPLATAISPAQTPWLAKYNKHLLNE